MEEKELVRYLVDRADDFAKQLEAKTQECEELRAAYNKAQDVLARVDKANELKSYSLQESIKECDRYRKALEEIKEVIKTNVCGECGWNSGVKLILEKVSRTKEE